MKKPLKDLKKRANDLLNAELSTEDKAWDIILDFYHHVLTRMEEQGMSQADLARELGKSRSAVSQLLNKTPNISVMRMVEIAEAANAEFTFIPIEQKQHMHEKSECKFIIMHNKYESCPNNISEDEKLSVKNSNMEESFNTNKQYQSLG